MDRLERLWTAVGRRIIELPVEWQALIGLLLVLPVSILLAVLLVRVTDCAYVVLVRALGGIPDPVEVAPRAVAPPEAGGGRDGPVGPRAAGVPPDLRTTERLTDVPFARDARPPDAPAARSRGLGCSATLTDGYPPARPPTSGASPTPPAGRPTAP